MLQRHPAGRFRRHADDRFTRRSQSLSRGLQARDRNGDDPVAPIRTAGDRRTVAWVSQRDPRLGELRVHPRRRDSDVLWQRDAHVGSCARAASSTAVLDGTLVLVFSASQRQTGSDASLVSQEQGQCPSAGEQQGAGGMDLLRAEDFFELLFAAPGDR
jgi:hypothetical protein